jgi:hypothetical protein
VAEGGQPRALDRAGVGLAHRHAGEDRVVGLAQPDPPVAAVERCAEARVEVLERAEAGVEQIGRDLRRVHADQERRAAHVGEGGREALRQAVAALGDDLELRGDPRAGLAVEDDDPAPGAARGEHGGERVLDRGRGQPRGLLGRARRSQARLDPAGDRLLGDHDERRGHVNSCAARRPPVHPRTEAMSRTARTVPRTVPVTFERPSRGR